MLKNIAIIIGTLFEIYSTNMYIKTFLEKKKIKKPIQFILYLGIIIFQEGASLFFQGTLLLIFSLVTAFLICQLFNSKQYIKMILSITIIIINIASEMLSSGLLMLIKDSDFEKINVNSSVFFIGTLLSKFIMFLLVIIVCLGKNKLIIDHIKFKQLIILSVLPLTTLSMLIIMYQILYVISSTKLKLMFTISSALLILSNIITFNIINQQSKLAKAEFELALLKDNIDEQSKHYIELRTSHEEIRQMRHNMKSICIGTIAELKSGKIENAIEELNKNIDIIEKSSRVIDTGHPAIDAVIENKLNKCNELNIKTNITYYYKNNVNINEIEIAVIIGNILDNAIEACQKLNNKDKEIWGLLSADNKNLIINIKNTTNILNDFKTSKKDKKSHGYGLRSISHIAEKYNGYAKFSFEDNIFTSYIILEN